MLEPEGTREAERRDRGWTWPLCLDQAALGKVHLTSLTLRFLDWSTEALVPSLPQCCLEGCVDICGCLTPDKCAVDVRFLL